MQFDVQKKVPIVPVDSSRMLPKFSYSFCANTNSGSGDEWEGSSFRPQSS